MAYQIPPTWVNGEPPSLNDVNLNIISDDIRDHQSRILALENGGAAGWKPPVGTITELRAINTTNYSDNTAIVVLGYHSAGDKAGARIYRFNRSSSVADNGGAIIAPTAGAGRWELLNPGNTWRVTHFGAKGLNNPADAANDRAAIQNCINWVDERSTAPGGGGGCAVFDQGSYYIDQTITASKCGLIGAIGSATGLATTVEIRWAGTAGGTMFLFGTDTEPDRWYAPIENLRFRNGSTIPGHLLHFQARLESYARLENIQGNGATGNFIRMGRGGLNTHIRRWRADGMGDYAIYAKLYSNDIISIKDFTVDNTLTNGYGVLDADGSANVSSLIQWLHVSNGRVEVNSNYPAGEAAFKFRTNSQVGQKTQFHAHFDNVQVAAARGVTNFDGIKVTPATDFVMFTLDECQMNVVGVPYYTGSKLGISSYHTHTVMAPHSAHIGSAPEADQKAVEVAGLTNFLGPVYADGLQAQPWHHQAASALPAGATVYKGYAFYDAAALTTEATSLVVSVCVDPGTVGTLSGVTASGTRGQAHFEVNTVAGLRLGQYLSIAGANTDVRIMDIDADTTTVFITSALSASVTSAAVSYKAPTYKTTTLTLT